MSTKLCNRCNEPYPRRGPNSRYCLVCADIVRRELACKHSYKHKLARGLIQKPGVGSGGNQLGKDNHRYTHGLYADFYKEGKKMKAEVRYCERCSKDLKYALTGEWAVHHRDHDRTHNERSNYELLCKRCHQLEHHCIDNLPNKERATTIP